jgi:hypothetical protein
VIRLVQRKAADPSTDPDGLARARQTLAREKGEAALGQLIEMRRAEANIWINPILQAPGS